VKGDSEPSIWCAGLSCLFRSLSKKNEINQTDQMNQISPTRREMVSTCVQLLNKSIVMSDPGDYPL
jgi:hypothetical protein